MAFQNIKQEELQKFIALLDQVLYNHIQWYHVVIRTLVCQLTPDKHELNPDSYKECRLGQWYYGTSAQRFQDHPGFIALGAAHKRMHDLAASLLISMDSGKRIPQLDYDGFSSALGQVQLELMTLKKEFENLLYNRDSLTLAISRLSMLPILREQQELVKRQGHSCCLAMMDLDLFKEVNDHYGHAAGDKILVVQARYLMDHLRVYDKVFRYGGEEFLICMPYTELKQASEILNRLCEEIAALPIGIGNGQTVRRSVSFGLTLLDPNLSVEESIDRSDKALYAAKMAGRNCIKIWEPGVS